MVHKNLYIEIIVKANVAETYGYRSLLFERPKNFVYDSGDWIDIDPIDGSLKGGKAYSLSSAPTEPDLMITFKEGYSEIKQRLANAVQGDRFIITQYGNDYKFTLRPHRPSVLIAGGVGVAPFRSMLKEMSDIKDKNNVKLIYLNKTDDFLFKNEFEDWRAKIPNFKLVYIVTDGLKKKDRVKILLDAIASIDNAFYIAGPEGMVESTEHLLIDFGVATRDIKIDSFGGY